MEPPVWPSYSGVNSLFTPKRKKSISAMQRRPGHSTACEIHCYWLETLYCCSTSHARPRVSAHTTPWSRISTVLTLTARPVPAKPTGSRALHTHLHLRCRAFRGRDWQAQRSHARRPLDQLPPRALREPVNTNSPGYERASRRSACLYFSCAISRSSS